MSTDMQWPRHRAKSAIKLKSKTMGLAAMRYCPICGMHLAEADAVCCPACGNRSRMKGRIANMIYKRIKINENGKAVICPHCNNEELTPGDYCMICGNEIVNRCADMRDEKVDRLVSKGCRAMLPGNARYCYKCGNQSSFYQKGWLKDWKSENTKKAIENINVAVDFEDLKSARTSG